MDEDDVISDEECQSGPTGPVSCPFCDCHLPWHKYCCPTLVETVAMLEANRSRINMMRKHLGEAYDVVRDCETTAALYANDDPEASRHWTLIANRVKELLATQPKPETALEYLARPAGSVPVPSKKVAQKNLL